MALQELREEVRRAVRDHIRLPQAAAVEDSAHSGAHVPRRAGQAGRLRLQDKCADSLPLAPQDILDGGWLAGACDARGTRLDRRDVLR